MQWMMFLAPCTWQRGRRCPAVRLPRCTYLACKVGRLRLAHMQVVKAYPTGKMSKHMGDMKVRKRLCTHVTTTPATVVAAAVQANACRTWHHNQHAAAQAYTT
jgi:hypothetical protein